MQTGKSSVLTINGGSSSIKFSLYSAAAAPQLLLKGQLENIGKGASFEFQRSDGELHSIAADAKDPEAAAHFLADWLKKQDGLPATVAVGHRIVHGMDHTGPALITAGLLDELKKISGYDPDHLPAEIRLIELFNKQYPGIPHIACFDTSFHSSMLPAAKLIPIPKRFIDKGVRRYGFHGLSYAYLVQELERVAGSSIANGKVIIAHLGSGASLAAIKDGKSVDSSMGFTPASGIPMSTRAGDLDPGVAWFMMQTDNSSPEAFSRIINHESGLLAVSETTADMKELLLLQKTDSRAAAAVELFCYQAKKWIGSFAAVLGGVDTLIFSGGMGERATAVRSKICSGLSFLGIELDEEKNNLNEAVVSTDAARVCVRVMKTNEEIMIAQQVYHFLQIQTTK